MIVISTDLMLGGALAYPLDTPVFGWHNLVTALNVSASSEDADFPAANVGNPLTFNTWKADASMSPVTIGNEVLAFSLDSADPLDYVGIARHNFGSGEIPVSIYGYSELTGSPAVPDWQLLVGPALLGDDEPAIFRFDPQALLGVEVRLGTGTKVAQCAVVYIGKLLVCQRGTHAAHVPITDGRATKTITGKAEAGAYLGRITTGRSSSTTFALKMVDEAWFRATMRPFVRGAAEDNPFFFAWAPQEFPLDVGYCWLTSDPRPTYDWETQTRAIELALGGIAGVSA